MIFLIFPPGITVRGILSLTGLAVLAGLSYGLLRWVESELRQPPPPESQEPVLVIEQFRAVRFNTAGRQESVLEAKRGWVAADQQSVRLEEVRGTYEPKP